MKSNKNFKVILGFLCMVVLVQAQSENKSPEPSDHKLLNAIPVLKYEAVNKLYNKNDDKLYVVNFWATWCSPCVEELPEFMEVNLHFNSNPNFKMLLISLDSPKDLEKKVKPFLIENKIEPDVFILDDVKRMNYWILAVNRSWTGSIPATVLYKNGKQLHFQEGQMTKDELTTLVEKYL